MSLAHGVVLGLLALALLKSGASFAPIAVRPIALGVMISAFALLILRYPYLRTTLLASWLSPLAAWSLVIALGSPSPRSPVDLATGVLVFASFHLITNLVTSAALFPALHAMGRLPVRDPSRCRNCGYSLAGLPAGRCPECGTPTS